MTHKQPLDKFDLEAQQEGEAIDRRAREHTTPVPQGKRITKDRKRIEKGDIKQNNRITRRYLLKGH